MPLSPEAQTLAVIVAVVVVLWVTEALPLAITSILPIILLPMFGMTLWGISKGFVYDLIRALCRLCV